MSFDSVKLKRNELCPCDSGKKYKKCCLVNSKLTNAETDEERAINLKGRKRLLNKMQNENIILHEAPDSMLKISDAIIQLAKDMLDSAKNKSERKTAIIAACVAWNIEALATDEDSLKNELNLFFATCVEDEKDQDGFTQIILSMIAKKKLLFPDEMRLVEDFEIIDTKSYFSVNVASRLPL